MEPSTSDEEPHNGNHIGDKTRNGRWQVAPPGLEGGWYKPLRDEDVTRIHLASLDVLWRTGVQVTLPECRRKFEEAGAVIDATGGRIRLPRSLVEDAVARAPSEVRLCGRDPEHDMRLGGRRVHMGTGGAAIKIVDLKTGRIRRTTLSDVARIGRLVDALDNIHFYLRACVAWDVPEPLLDLNTFYAAICNTSKHVTGSCSSVSSARDVVQMAAIICGGLDRLQSRPIISFVTSWLVSPLRFDCGSVEVATELIRLGMPIFISSAPQSGATSPAALAGTLVQINAEELAGVTYSQLLRPGAPVVMGYVPSVSDLRTAQFSAGAPEFALMQAAAAQIGRFYNLPVYNSSGLTDSKVPDIQAGYEKGIGDMAAVLAGANYIHHSAGFLENLLTVAYEQYVIDDDINGCVMRTARGIEVNDETLSVDVIDQVCRGGNGHYLTEQQTLDLMHTEYYYPHTADRQSRTNWQLTGKQDARTRARHMAADIIRTHHPLPISAEADAQIRERFHIRLAPDLANVAEPAR